MPVVSNTSPLLSLAIIGRLSLLREQFSEVLIPPKVLEELRVEEALPGSDALREAMHIGWLRSKRLMIDRSFTFLGAIWITAKQKPSRWRSN